MAKISSELFSTDDTAKNNTSFSSFDVIIDEPKCKKINKKFVFVVCSSILGIIIFLLLNMGKQNEIPTIVENKVDENFVPEVPKQHFYKISYDINKIGPPRAGDVGQIRYDQDKKAYNQVHADDIKNSDSESAEILQAKQEIALQELQMKKQAIESQLVLTSYDGGGGDLSNNTKNEFFQAASNMGQQHLSQYQQQNNQHGKQSFLDRVGANKNLTNNFHEESIESPYTIISGTIIPCTLVNAINSDLPGPVIAQVRENVYNSISGKHLLIPQGAKLIGQYNSEVAYGQDRVQLAFSRIIFPASAKYPNGYSIQLAGFQGSDLDGHTGLDDRVNYHFGKLMAAAVLTSVISATSYNMPDGRNYPLSNKQMMFDNIGQEVNQIGQKVISKQLNKAPTINIRQELPFNVIVVKDLTLSPR